MGEKGDDGACVLVTPLAAVESALDWKNASEYDRLAIFLETVIAPRYFEGSATVTS